MAWYFPERTVTAELATTWNTRLDLQAEPNVILPDYSGWTHVADTLAGQALGPFDEEDDDEDEEEEDYVC